MGGHSGRRDREMLDKNPACERCGGPTHYMVNITAPVQSPIESIYECRECGRQTWVKLSTEHQQPRLQEKPE